MKAESPSDQDQEFPWDHHSQTESDVDRLFTENESNPVILKQCLRQYREIGNTGKALKTCNYLLRIEPENIPVMIQASEMFYDLGRFDNFEKAIRRLITLEPDKLSHYLNLATHFLESQKPEQCESLIQQSEKHLTDKDFRILKQRCIPSKPDSTDDAGSNAEINPADFLNLFGGREDMYARQWKSKDDRTGYVPVHEPLTVNVIRNHLAGNFTAGFYPVNLDNQVRCIALDLDIRKYALKQYFSD